MSRDGDVLQQITDEKKDSFFSLHDVSLSYGDRIVLDHLNLDVPNVRGVGLVGLSGSGKTTLFRCLLGLQQHSGSVTLLGEKVSWQHNNIKLYRRLGVLFQKAALFNDLSVIENCVFAQELAGEKIDVIKIEEVLVRLNLWDARDLLPRQLSGGMQHRAGLARTLVRDSKCLMLDEPTTGQDSENAFVIQELLMEYQVKNNAQLIIVSHDYFWLKPLIEWSVLIHDGTVAYEGELLMTMKSTQEVVGC